jgi:L-asparaginase
MVGRDIRSAYYRILIATRLQVTTLRRPTIVNARYVLVWSLAVASSTVLAQDAKRAPLPVVWVLSTGGTIAGQGTTSTSLSNYKAGSLRGEELVGAVPEIKQYANVKVEQVFNVSSSDLTVGNWLTLARRINAIFVEDPGVAGVVVTHGTNTLEETAYFLNLTVKDNRPVVLVGSQRPATAISADGPLNLLNAIRVASTPEARGKGVLVVMNDEINGARDVTKTNTYRVETFRAPELGFLGYVDADKVSFYRASTRRHTTNSEFDVSSVRDLPQVDIVYSYVEPNTSVFQALVASGTKGIVFAGAGAGALSAAERAALKALFSVRVGSKPVLVRSSRVGNGRVIALTANQEEYAALGMIPADTLNPQKARILLMLALSTTTDITQIRRMFEEY